jgi:long-chain fatty acid transport protein
MTRTIKLAVAAAMALGTTSAFATNGDNLIGLGAKSRAMGGTGVAAFYGAESALTNPALLTQVKGTQVSFGGTVFMPNVKNSATMTVPNPAATGPSDMSGEDTSDANMNVIPEVSIAGHVTDNIVLGIGMFGSAGMGVDYREGTKNPMAFRMATNLQLMKMAPSIAYEPIDGLSIGAAAVLQYHKPILFQAAARREYGAPDEHYWHEQSLKVGWRLGEVVYPKSCPRDAGYDVEPGVPPGPPRSPPCMVEHRHAS